MRSSALKDVGVGLENDVYFTGVGCPIAAGNRYTAAMVWEDVSGMGKRDMGHDLGWQATLVPSYTGTGMAGSGVSPGAVSISSRGSNIDIISIVSAAPLWGHEYTLPRKTRAT